MDLDNDPVSSHPVFFCLKGQASFFRGELWNFRGCIISNDCERWEFIQASGVFLSPIKKWLRPLGASFGGGHVEWFLMDPQEVVWSQWWGVNPGETLRCCIYFCGGWKLPQEKNGDYLWKPIFKDPYFSQSGMSQGFLITALFRLAFTWLLILGFFRNGWVIHHKNSQ